VLNLPSAALAGAVDRLALTTGAHPVPLDKAWLGFEHESAKWRRSGLTPTASEIVGPARVAECPLQLEAVVESIHPFGESNPMVPTPVLAVELRIVRVHAHEAILASKESDHIDPDIWNPLIMSFRRFYGLSRETHGSRLGTGDDQAWRPAPRGAMPPPPQRRVTTNGQRP
jgi:flavin reductase (DIM6/NTAB) family NADH-FMN oxidoreductase RutF